MEIRLSPSVWLGEKWNEVRVMVYSLVPIERPVVNKGHRKDVSLFDIWTLTESFCLTEAINGLTESITNKIEIDSTQERTSWILARCKSKWYLKSVLLSHNHSTQKWLNWDNGVFRKSASARCRMRYPGNSIRVGRHSRDFPWFWRFKIWWF